MSLLHHDGRDEAFDFTSHFREDYGCLTRRADSLFELCDAMLCEDGPVTSPVDLTLLAEHRRRHGALHDALNQGCIDADRPRKALAVLPQPKAADGRLVLAVDVSPWLRPDAPTSPDRLFCHVYGRSGRSSDQFIPGWPYSFVAALETGRTSWCQPLDAIRLGPHDDVAEAAARQVRRVVNDLIGQGQWEDGDPDILVVFDAGYDAPRMAYLLTGLPIQVLGRMRSDRVMRRPTPTQLEYALPTPRAGGRQSTARSSASPNRTRGASPTRRPCRSPTAMAPPRRWPGTVSTPGSPPAPRGSTTTANSPSSRAP